ncbi:fasciclin-like arabinogalactan protein 6 [Aristolochia californica]|uniref:fasciclin-like arabinogalactan protein 6 n=1 Tax=Aristolochia californica TaxID=171875 RepID=UPI0035DAEAF3
MLIRLLLSLWVSLNADQLRWKHLQEMAASLSSLVLLFLAFSSAVLSINAQSAPAPSPSPVNLTGILEKGGQYTTLIRLLGSTQVGSQIENQLNNSNQGMTLFAPTDNAFNNLKPGTLNGLNMQQQVALVLYHVIPKFYRLQDFETVSNPVRTQASGNGGGVYGLNFTSTQNQVNVSTGVVETQLNNVLRSNFPLAVYGVDKVLLPSDLFGAKAPSTSPPASNDSPSSPKSPSTPKSTEGPSTAQPNAGSKTTSLGWGLVVLMAGAALL